MSFLVQFLKQSRILDGNANIASLVPFSFWALIMGMSKGGLPGAGNLTVAIYALVLEDAWSGRRTSFRRVAFACFDLRRRNGNARLPEACRLEIYCPVASFLFGGNGSRLVGF